MLTFSTSLDVYKTLTLQQFTDRPNNDRRSLGSLYLYIAQKYSIICVNDTGLASVSNSFSSAVNIPINEEYDDLLYIGHKY